MFKCTFERKWTFCKSRNVCGCSKALTSFKDYRLFCVVQCPLTFVADEPGANRNCTEMNRWRWYWRQLWWWLWCCSKCWRRCWWRKKSSSKNLGGYSTLDDKFVICNKLENNGKSYPKHRKNCECCPGHYLIVNHYSSMSWFKFRNLSEMVNCVTNSLNHS